MTAALNVRALTDATATACSEREYPGNKSAPEVTDKMSKLGEELIEKVDQLRDSKQPIKTIGKFETEET